jgi:hypothetical protein
MPGGKSGSASTKSRTRLTPKAGVSWANYMYDTTKFAMEGARKQIKLQQASNAAKPKRPGDQQPRGPQANVAQQLVTQVHLHEISLGGRELGAIQTDAAGSDVLQQLMDELERGARTSGVSF